MSALGRGSIVNVSSRVASHGTPGCAAYTAMKGGLEALTRSVAVDFAATGIRCNAVRPDDVRTGSRLHRERVVACRLARHAGLRGVHRDEGRARSVDAFGRR